MSKGGGRGSAQQMQQSAFGGGVDYLGGSSSFNESFNPGPYQDTMAPQPQPFDAGLLIPQDNRQGMPSLPPQGGLSDNITGFIPYSPDNASGGSGGTVIGDFGLLRQLQPINQPAPTKVGNVRDTAGIKPQRDDMAYIGGTPDFYANERNSRYRTFMPQPMPRRQPPIFQSSRNFPFPMPPRMPPQMPYRRPSIPGMNTQFQMPSFGRSYGQMNPYAGQFSGYGVPSNMLSFAQPHDQPNTPLSLIHI